jgi:hypothetical protein
LVKRALLASILLLVPALAGAQELTAEPTPHVADPEAQPPPPPRAEQRLQANQDCYPPPPPGHTHDGFYLRLQAGGGKLTARRGLTTTSGTALTYGLAVGGMVYPNLAVFATVLFHDVSDPTWNPYGYAMTFNAGDLGTESFGAGLAYYLDPANVYVAAAVLAKSAEITDGAKNNRGSSNRGAGFQAMLGKEWWVGAEWGLGLAAEVTGAWMTDTNDHSTTWSSFSYSLVLSATYN